MAACGQTSAHLLHWMQISGSQTGISRAMLRFSHCVVPVGQVPSTGNALTGSRSPLPAIITAVTVLTKSGRLGRHDRRPARARAVACAGHLHLVQVGQRLVDRGEVPLDDLLALLAVGLLDRLLDLGDGLLARQHAGDGEEAGLHDRVDAPAHAGVLGDLVGVDHVELQLLVDDLLLHLARQVVPDLVRAVRGVQQEHRARLRRTRARRTSRGSSNWWQATKFARLIRYGERIGCGPKRRCEIVIAPDFFES